MNVFILRGQFWTIQGGVGYSQSLHATKTGISSGLMGCMQTFKHAACNYQVMDARERLLRVLSNLTREP